MSSKPQQVSSCDPSRVDSYLKDQISTEDESALMLHLDDCDSCRERLQASAADPGTWNEFENALSDEPFDSVLLSNIGNAANQDRASEACTTEKIVLSVLTPTDDPKMLGRLGPHEISGVIGSGGMGVVLKAHDRSLDRTIAIKVLAPHLASSGAARKRFAREAKAAAAVLHPNVIAIHGVSNDAALPYLVMPYRRGESLQRRLDRLGSLSTAETLRIGQQVAAGLAAAHLQGLVHRDIKPANIMLEDGVERVTITDFGLARAVDDATMTRSGVIAGTPQYMSPEQARGEAIDARSDLFSLGSVLHAMCTGRSPFRAETSYGVLHRITHESPRPIRDVNPEAPTWLCRLIESLHKKSPGQRLQSAEQVELLLMECVAHIEQPDQQSLPKRLEDSSRKSNVWTSLVAVTAVVSILAAAASFPWTNKWTGEPQSEPTTNPGAEASNLAKTQTSQATKPAAVELVDSGETDWVDSFEPAPQDVKANAQRLESETQLFFASGPEESSAKIQPRNEGTE